SGPPRRVDDAPSLGEVGLGWVVPAPPHALAVPAAGNEPSHVGNPVHDQAIGPGPRRRLRCGRTGDASDARVALCCWHASVPPLAARSLILTQEAWVGRVSGTSQPQPTPADLVKHEARRHSEVEA